MQIQYAVPGTVDLTGATTFELDLVVNALGTGSSSLWVQNYLTSSTNGWITPANNGVWEAGEGTSITLTGALAGLVLNQTTGFGVQILFQSGAASLYSVTITKVAFY
jgi:hypothetical protein